MKHLLKSLACTALLSMGIVSAQTITFWHTYNQDSDENKTLLEKVIPAFEKANPGIKVQSQVVPYPDFRQKLLTSIAGGTVPDVARIDNLSCYLQNASQTLEVVGKDEPPDLEHEAFEGRGMNAFGEQLG